MISILFYTQQGNSMIESLGNKTDTTTSTTKPVKSDSKKAQDKYPGNSSDWDLLLVNEQHKIQEEPTNLKELSPGERVDSRIYEAYQALNDAAKKAGHDLVIVSAYRSVAEQEVIVERDTTNYINQGFSTEEASKKAMAYLTKPGLSEHHTGLALDVLESKWYADGNMLEGEFGDTEAGKWLDKNVCHYGFVIRYQKGKEQITGINYEPWHIRYVGKENAEYMHDHNLVLEEYVEQLNKVGK